METEGVESKAGLYSRGKVRVRAVRLKHEMESNQYLDQEVIGHGQHSDSEKFSGSWQGCEAEEGCSWSEGSAQGHALCQTSLLGKDLELSKTS